MNVFVNGEGKTVSEGLNIIDLLAELGVQMPDMVSVELNGRILKRDVYETTSVAEGDKLEFLYFMGGGRFVAGPEETGHHGTQ